MRDFMEGNVMTRMVDRIMGQGAAKADAHGPGRDRSEMTSRPPQQQDVRDRVEVSAEARRAEESALAASQATGGMTADVFGVDKAVDAWPGLGVAKEGPIERPVLKAMTSGEASADKPAATDDKPDGPESNAQVARSAAERSSRPRSVDVETHAGPASAERSVSDLPPGARQDVDHERIGGSMTDVGGRSGTYLNVEG
jgi:hypothetical protein